MYSKPALNIPTLITRLKAKGLNIPDVSLATNSLSRIGYFRLLIYMRPFQDRSKQFTNNCDFSHILQLYEFDRELRILCLDAIERIEVTLRAAITDTVTIIYGPHFYTDPSHYAKPLYCNKFLTKVREAKSLAIEHYTRNYKTPTEPPIWTALEAISFGTSSKFFAGLNPRNRRMIAQRFSYPEPVLVSWFRCTAVFRNMCAHHHRIWNAKFTVNKPMTPNAMPGVFISRDSFHARAVVLYCLLKDINPNIAIEWRNQLQEILTRYSSVVQIQSLGFSNNDPFWTL